MNRKIQFLVFFISATYFLMSCSKDMSLMSDSDLISGKINILSFDSQEAFDQEIDRINLKLIEFDSGLANEISSLDFSLIATEKELILEQNSNLKRVRKDVYERLVKNADFISQQDIYQNIINAPDQSVYKDLVDKHENLIEKDSMGIVDLKIKGRALSCLLNASNQVIINGETKTFHPNTSLKYTYTYNANQYNHYDVGVLPYILTVRLRLFTCNYLFTRSVFIEYRTFWIVNGQWVEVYIPKATYKGNFSAADAIYGDYNEILYGQHEYEKETYISKIGSVWDYHKSTYILENSSIRVEGSFSGISDKTVFYKTLTPSTILLK